MSSKENFVFYASWIDIIKAYDATDPGFAGELAKQMIYFGVEGETSTDNPIIAGLIQSMCATLIDKSKKRHRACIENGKKGGRKKKLTYEQVIELQNLGFDLQDIADNLMCSVRTVQRTLDAGPGAEINTDVDDEI